MYFGTKAPAYQPLADAIREAAIQRARRRADWNAYVRLRLVKAEA